MKPGFVKKVLEIFLSPNNKDMYFDSESTNHVLEINLNDKKISAQNKDQLYLIKHEEEDPLNQYLSQNSQTCLVYLHRDNESEYLVIAPCEGKKSLSTLQNTFCEEQAFAYLFPTGTFGYFYEMKQTSSPARYFNQWFLNYNQIFSSRAEFFSQFSEK